MKKILLLLFVSLFTFSSCGTALSLKGSDDTSKWYRYQVGMKPSQLSSNGSVFYRAQINNDEYIEVYYDKSLSADATYYYNQLLQQYGWTRNGDAWSASQSDIRPSSVSQYSIRPSRSVLHISVKRGVAVYIYPDSFFRVFKVARKYDTTKTL